MKLRPFLDTQPGKGRYFFLETTVMVKNEYILQSQLQALKNHTFIFFDHQTNPAGNCVRTSKSVRLIAR